MFSLSPFDRCLDGLFRQMAENEGAKKTANSTIEVYSPTLLSFINNKGGKNPYTFIY